MPRPVTAVALAVYLSTLLVDQGGPDDELVITRIHGALDMPGEDPVIEVSVGVGPRAPRFLLTVEAVDA